MPKKDLVGKTFNNWTLVSPVIVDSKIKGWNCKCACGNEKQINNISTVICGKSTSCGCLRSAFLKHSNPMFKKDVRDKVSMKLKSDPNRRNILAKAVKAATSKESIEKRIATNRIKYGGNSPASSEEIRAKIAQTNISKYGGNTPAQNPEIIDKMRSTMIERYGVNNIMKLDSYRKLVSEKISSIRRSKGIEQLPNGLLVVDECKQQGVLTTTYRNWRRELGPEAAQAKLYGEKLLYRSNLERAAIELLSPLCSQGASVEIWNKKAHESMRYKPDIKISYQSAIIFLDVDGLYWHSVDSDEDESDKNYHLDKAAEFVKHGLNLMQIREDELRDKGGIVLSMIAHRLGMSKINFGARQLKIGQVPYDEAYKFFNENHLMGCHNGSKSIGLYHDKDLVCALSFRVEKDILDISRFACKKDVSVSGGFSKLLSYLESTYIKVSQITNFIDLRYATGNSSKISNFTVDSVHLGFKWTDGKKTYNRRYCKADLSKGLSEKAMAENMGLYKIYDAGQLKLIKKIRLS
jgi:hypothetical protein